MNELKDSWLYVAPNELYAISRASNETDWTKIFGDNYEEYYVCRYDNSLHEYNLKHPELHLSDFYIFQAEEKLENCFWFLLKHGIISKNEYDFQIENLGKLDKN